MVNDQMIADEQGIFHRSRGDHVVLRNESENEQAHHQHGADAGDGFKGRFFYPSFSGLRRGRFCWRLFVLRHG